jgi:uncharacterized iron-regulated membrane protein
MNKRDYNVLFHTHTVSGIVISVVLYIIFFCGAFSLFKDEITAWEKGEKVDLIAINNIDVDRIIDTLKQRNYNLFGRDIHIRKADVKEEMYVRLSASKELSVVNDPSKLYYFNIHTDTYKVTSYYSFYSIGEFIYRLHFFSQIPSVGMYLAGMVAFFFLFAIVTGVLIHWKKIISNFFLFRPAKKIKMVWSDAHTVLGVIGLPFQFMFGVTSCFLALSILVLAPANYLYNNNQKKLMEDFRPMMKSEAITEKGSANNRLNTLLNLAVEKWDNFTPETIRIRNYGAKNMSFQVDGLLDSKERFLGNGRLIYDVNKKELLSIKNPYKSDYLESVEFFMRKMHYGDYGGILVKIVYFILALITCFVIISGVLIWLEARNKKNISPKKKLYNLTVGHIYLAISLSLYPIIAFSLLFAKLLPRSYDNDRQSILYTVFFLVWLLLSVFFTYKRDNYFTTKNTLLFGGILGIFIPFVNGFSSGNWIWVTFVEKQNAILFVDIFWICLSLISCMIVFKMERKESNNRYKSLKEELI